MFNKYTDCVIYVSFKQMLSNKTFKYNIIYHNCLYFTWILLLLVLWKLCNQGSAHIETLTNFPVAPNLDSEKLKAQIALS